VDGVAKRVEERDDVLRDRGVDLADVAAGDREELGEGAGAVDADFLGVRAEVAAAGEAVAAAVADDVPFAGNEFAGADVGDAGADGFDNTAEFVADGHRHRDGAFGPGVPFPDVEVGAADGGLADFDQDVHRADFAGGDVLEGESGAGGGFDQGLHGRENWATEKGDCQ